MCFSAMAVVADIDTQYYNLMQSNNLKFQFDKDKEFDSLPVLRKNRFDMNF